MAFANRDVFVCRRVAPNHERKGGVKGVAVFPRNDGHVFFDVPILKRKDDAPERVPHVDELACLFVEHAVPPPMMAKVREARDKGPRRLVRPNRQKDVHLEARHKSVREGCVMHRNDAIVPPAPKAGVPHCGSRELSKILIGNYPANA